MTKAAAQNGSSLQVPSAPHGRDRSASGSVRAGFCSVPEDELSIALAHKLDEHLAALLLYLHELMERDEHATDAGAAQVSMHEIVARALRETQRVCDIVSEAGSVPNEPVAAIPASTHDNECLTSWLAGADAGIAGNRPAFPPRNGRHSLTPREEEVLALIADGNSNNEGGMRLGISTRTFETHRAHIMRKLDARNVADLVRKA